MAVCPGRGHSRRACSVTDVDGDALATGDVVTGEAALRGVSVQNGLVKVTYELPNGAEPGACHLFVNGGHTADDHEDSWTRCFPEAYGDWSFWVVPMTLTADRIVVIESSDDACEISIEWTAHDLDTDYLSTAGLTSRDYARNVIYPSSSVNARLITEVHLRKVVRVMRGVQGYYVAWRSDPNVVPKITAVGQAANNETDLGEREIGTGGGTRVAWAKNGNVCYSPAWRSQRDWSAVAAAKPGMDNYAWWAGSDDPTADPWNHATVIAMEPAGYPAEAATGDFWVADLYPANSVLRVIVQKNPLPIGVWHYDGQNGQLVNHLTNPWTESDGRLTRFPIFIGADHYTADATSATKAGYTGSVAYANEPTAMAQAAAAVLVSGATEDWPT